MKTRFKLWTDCLKPNSKILLKQRLDFPFEKEIETMDIFTKIQNIVETTVKFLFENKIETMDTLAKMHGHKLLKQRLDIHLKTRLKLCIDYL